MTNRSRTWLSVTVAAVLAAGAYYVVRREEGSRPPPPPTPVAVAPVRSGDVPIELEGLGRVTASNVVTVRTMVGGQIKRIAFQDGQAVEAGDVLVQIDPRQLQATVDQDKANLDRDRSSLANAEADLRRYGPLVGQGIVSQQQLDTQRALVTQLRAAVAASVAALARDQVQLGFTTITAPIAGLLGLRLVDVGNVVSPGDPGGLVVLTQVQPITVLFTLPQASLADIQERQAAAGADGLAVEAWTQDGSRKLDEGRLQALSNQVDAQSGTVTLKGVFPNPRRSLWPGASVVARLVLDVQKDGLTVPAAALDQGPQGAFVWVVAPDNTVHPTPVKVRQTLGGEALIASGLQAGQQVVTDGQYGLTSGAHVAVQQPSQQASAGGPELRRNGANRLGISP